MGAGPHRLFERGIEPCLRDRGSQIHVESVTATQPFRAEISTTFHLHRLVADCVRGAVERKRFPLVLSGNCNTALGTIAGAGADRLGVIWLDAHGDFNTPETTTSGFLDGMGLATIAGLCWKKMAASVPGFRSISGDHIIHVGGRDISDTELRSMRDAGVHLCDAATINQTGARATLAAAIHALRDQTDRVYLHLDLDVLEPTHARANEFTPPGGLPVDAVPDVIELVTNAFAISAIGVASYDPAQDANDQIAHAGRRLIEAALPSLLCEAGQESGRRQTAP